MAREKRHRVPRSLVRNARDLRRDATFPERLLWSRLRHGRKAGMTFRRQHPIDHFVLDFYCPAARLAIEVDGRSHRGRHAADLARMRYLNCEHGIEVLRVSNDSVLDNIDGVVKLIVRRTEERMREISESDR